MIDQPSRIHVRSLSHGWLDVWIARAFSAKGVTQSDDTIIGYYELAQQ